MEALADIAMVPEPSHEYLNPRQRVDYRTERQACLEWLYTVGKNPDRAERYAVGTLVPRASRMDQFTAGYVTTKLSKL